MVGKLEELVTEGCVEVAYPAGAESLFGGCQTEVLNGYGYIYVAMMLAVGAYPLFVVADGGYDVEGCFGKPLTIVAALEFLTRFVALDYVEMPGLAIDC